MRTRRRTRVGSNAEWALPNPSLTLTLFFSSRGTKERLVVGDHGTFQKACGRAGQGRFRRGELLLFRQEFGTLGQQKRRDGCCRRAQGACPAANGQTRDGLGPCGSSLAGRCWIWRAFGRGHAREPRWSTAYGRSWRWSETARSRKPIRRRPGSRRGRSHPGKQADGELFACARSSDSGRGHRFETNGSRAGTFRRFGLGLLELVWRGSRH